MSRSTHLNCSFSTPEGEKREKHLWIITAEQKDGSTEIEIVIHNEQLYYSQYRWREMIIFKIINMVLKDIDHHRSDNKYGQSEGERERDQYRNTNNNAVVM